MLIIAPFSVIINHFISQYFYLFFVNLSQSVKFIQQSAVKNSYDLIPNIVGVLFNYLFRFPVILFGLTVPPSFR